MNYFQIFAVDVDFNLNLVKLADVYQSLQKAVHPDRFAHASSQEQLLAVKKSTLINDAYQTLKHPLKRAEYLLNLRAVEMPAEQASFSDNQFLMRQMELREMLDEIKHADDVEGAITQASTLFKTEYQALFQIMQAQLLENTATSNQLASEYLRKLKFYQKLQQELDRLEELLLDN